MYNIEKKLNFYQQKYGKDCIIDMIEEYKIDKYNIEQYNEYIFKKNNLFDKINYIQQNEDADFYRLYYNSSKYDDFYIYIDKFKNSVYYEYFIVILIGLSVYSIYNIFINLSK